MTDKQTPTDAATPECLTCSDHGAVGNSGFDYKTAADFLSGKTVSDEALRKFVAASRGAHDARAALHAKMLSLQGELASREAEIALLKRSLLDAEADAAAPQHSTTAQSAESVPALDRDRIREIFMAHSFTVKEGQTDLKQYVYDAAEALLRAARAQADSVQEDAARYRWLAASCRSTSEHWGGRWSIIIDGPAPKSHDSEDDFDAAVDAARKQGAAQ